MAGWLDGPAERIDGEVVAGGAPEPGRDAGAVEVPAGPAERAGAEPELFGTTLREGEAEGETVPERGVPE